MKRLGHCTLCETQVFEMPNPSRIGAPRENARRVTFVLMDGTQADCTFCDECVVSPESLPAIHRAWMEAWRREGGPDPISQVDNVPIGVLFEESWQDAILREKRHVRTHR